MIRQILLPRTVIAIVVLSLTSALPAEAKVIVSHGAAGVVIAPRVGLGVWIGATPVRHVPAHRRVAVTGPWRHRFVRLGSPHAGAVVVHHPVKRHVTVNRRPAVTLRAPTVIERGLITVWVTNSNGSRTSVRLARQGHWYVGPRGEYYREMPTNEQLRMAYGF